MAAELTWFRLWCTKHEAKLMAETGAHFLCDVVCKASHASQLIMTLPLELVVL